MLSIMQKQNTNSKQQEELKRLNKTYYLPFRISTLNVQEVTAHGTLCECVLI